MINLIPDSPFQKTRNLLSGITPKDNIIDLSIGSPRHPIPAFIKPIINDNFEQLGSYPSSNTNINFGENALKWLVKRYNINPENIQGNNILPVSGSREGLFTIAFIIKNLNTINNINKNIFLMPNPFYPVYAAAAVCSNHTPLAIDVDESTNYLPDLEQIPDKILADTAAFYICSPSNPQGSIADIKYFKKLYALALKWNFIIISDECYSEIYRDLAPPSILEVAETNNFEKIITFNSLSKRSNVPGLRSGIAVGDPHIIDSFYNLRNIAAATIPIPLQIASETLWSDEEHVILNRKLYNEKFTLTESSFHNLYDYKTPPGGFFIWLNIKDFGTDEEVTKKLWEHASIKVIPGSYLAMKKDNKKHTSEEYIRIALVGEYNELKIALQRIKQVLK